MLGLGLPRYDAAHVVASILTPSNNIFSFYGRAGRLLEQELRKIRADQLPVQHAPST